jgi:predicted RNA binding protein YcfA (HicA-like mRNA interferase family)
MTVISAIVIPNKERAIYTTIELLHNDGFKKTFPPRLGGSHVRIRKQQQRLALAARPTRDSPISAMGIAKDLHNVWRETLKSFFDARIVKLPEAQVAWPTDRREKFVGIPLKQRDVPANRYPKFGIQVAGDTPITEKEDAKINILNFGNFPVPRGEVLNRVTYRNCEANRPHVKTTVLPGFTLYLPYISELRKT